MQRNTQQWYFLAGLLIASLLSASAMAQGKNMTTLKLITFSPDTGVAVAQARGLFAAEGVAPQIIQTRSSTQQMQGLSRGSYDIALTAFDNVLAWSGKEGADIAAIAQREDGVTLPLFVRPEIKTLGELKGRKLAVDAVDTAYAFVLRRILLDAGLDFKRGDYQLVPAGAPAERVASMKRGETYAGIINIPWDVQAASEGLVPFLYDRGFLKGYVGSVIAVNRAWAQSHRKELVGFLRAWRSALQWLNAADKEAARNLIVAQAKVNPGTAAGMLASVSKNGVLDRSGAQQVLALRSQFAGPPVKGTDLKAYVDTSYFEAASPR